jgi:hypothetical protein
MLAPFLNRCVLPEFGKLPPISIWQRPRLYYEEESGTEDLVAESSPPNKKRKIAGGSENESLGAFFGRRRSINLWTCIHCRANQNPESEMTCQCCEIPRHQKDGATVPAEPVVGKGGEDTGLLPSKEPAPEQGSIISAEGFAFRPAFLFSRGTETEQVENNVPTPGRRKRRRGTQPLSTVHEPVQQVPLRSSQRIRAKRPTTPA